MPEVQPACSLTRRASRIAALGFSDADTDALFRHYSDAEQRGKRGHGYSRIPWLETLPDLDPTASPGREFVAQSHEVWDGRGALGYLTLNAIVEAQLAEPPEHRASSRRRTASRPACSATTSAGSPTAGSSPC